MTIERWGSTSIAGDVLEVTTRIFQLPTFAQTDSNVKLLQLPPRAYSNVIKLGWLALKKSRRMMVRNLDLAAILLDLHRMRLELERRFGDIEAVKKGQSEGKMMNRDYIKEEMNKVVVYITTCGILRRVWERCRDTVELLKALKIKAEFRDLNLDPSYADELADRMRLDKSDRELVYDGLPMVYVNGKYFGNDATLIQENENKNLVEILREFQGRQECSTCLGSGYTVCSYCRGGKKAKETFRVRLRCARCDRNGIAPCTSCTPPKV
ncbi:glutaredoxin [Teladorsagia circumcincta]|uniref:Glutaredoxin n=1 Tax=Teladorsagia circumcincta TaxID=45464 RepID=A0A2G9UX29_TELCI|nr:glutaredoxin [Teladorsagia circumcincta]